jgi:hypothetical protein
MAAKFNVPNAMRKAGSEPAIVGKWHLVGVPTGVDY